MLSTGLNKLFRAHDLFYCSPKELSGSGEVCVHKQKFTAVTSVFWLCLGCLCLILAAYMAGPVQVRLDQV